MSSEGAVLENIRIVLVEPAGPLNIGSVARIMKNMGLRNLVLVNPHCDPLGAEARQMAVHAADILEGAQRVDSIPDALVECYRAIATTGRPRSATATLEHPRQALPWLLDTPSALIFGPEDRGLNNEELNYAQRFIGIPSHPAYPSLNLAQAVAVCCYELYQLTQFPDPIQPIQIAPVAHHPPEPSASMDALEGYFQHLERILLPYCDPLGAEARQMAVHAADILEGAQRVDSIPDALVGCYRAIATTGRPRSATATLEHPRQALPWLLDTPSALIFGPEDRGLNNEELNYAQRFIGIPSHPDYPSLNLAQAVAVCCYELYQLTQFPDPIQPIQIVPVAHPPPEPPASMDALEGYFQHLEHILLDIGFLFPHTAASRMQKIRQIFGRSQLSVSELALLRGILRQTAWATRRKTLDSLDKDKRPTQ
jgi:tRNA/rRNA methyltransferase